MRPLRLIAEGFRGIQDGLGLDRLEADLANLSGIVAITGDNGRGKSTFLGLLQPWPVLPDHGNDIYSQVSGPALKQLEFEAGGNVWRSVLEVNPRHKRIRASLYRQEGSGWQPASQDNIKSTGTMATYQDLLANIISPEDLFFATAFRSQRARPLATMKPAELKGVIVQALDIPGLEALGQKASRVSNALSDHASGLSGSLKSQKQEQARLEKIVAGATELPPRLIALREVEKQTRTAYEKALTALAEARARAATQLEALARRQEAETRLGVLAAEKASLVQERGQIEEELSRDQLECNTSIATARQSLTGAPAAEKAHKELPQATLSAKNYEDQVAAKEALAEKLNTEIGQLALLEKQLSETAGEITRLEAQLTYLRDQGTGLRKTADLLTQVTCDTRLKTSCRLLGDARTSQETLPSIREKYAIADQAKKAALARSSELTTALAPLESLRTSQTENDLSLRTAREARDQSQKKLTRLQTLAANLPVIQAARQTITDAEARLARFKQTSQGRTAATNRKILGIEGDISALRQRLAADPVPTIDVGHLETEEQATRAKVDQASSNCLELERLITETEVSAKALDRITTEIHDLSAQIVIHQSRAARFSLVSKAFSKSGVISLLIEEVGPALAAETNALLQNCFGGRFAVSVRTVVEKAGGSGTKEVFDLLVYDYDSSSSDPKSLGDLSGGELSMVEPAITHALALINSSKAGKRLQATFSDEILKSISPANRVEGFEMFRQFHNRGGFDTSYLITHEEDIWARCDRILQFTDGGIVGLN
jgi:exonuclease SbcC